MTGFYIKWNAGLKWVKEFKCEFSLRENTEFFLVRIFLNSVRIQENTDQKNSVFGLFLRSVFCSKFKQPCLCFTSLEPLILFYVHNSAISYVYRNVLKYTVLLMVFVLVSLLMTLNKNFLTRWCDMSFFGSLLISYDYALFLTIRLFPYQGNRGHYLFLGG